jgi:chromosome partitioning protein
MHRPSGRESSPRISHRDATPHQKWTVTAYQWTAQKSAKSTQNVDHTEILDFPLGSKLAFTKTSAARQSAARRRGKPEPPSHNQPGALRPSRTRASTSEPGMPDHASRVYIERALKLAEQYPELFPNDAPSSAFVLAEGLRGAGKISGALGIPISQLEIGEFKTVDRKRIQVNKSATRYQNQIRYIGEML